MDILPINRLHWSVFNISVFTCSSTVAVSNIHYSVNRFKNLEAPDLINNERSMETPYAAAQCSRYDDVRYMM